jgi:hypothetical protein
LWRREWGRLSDFGVFYFVLSASRCQGCLLRVVRFALSPSGCSLRCCLLRVVCLRRCLLWVICLRRFLLRVFCLRSCLLRVVRFTLSDFGVVCFVMSDYSVYILLSNLLQYEPTLTTMTTRQPRQPRQPRQQ